MNVRTPSQSNHSVHTPSSENAAFPTSAFICQSPISQIVRANAYVNTADIAGSAAPLVDGPLQARVRRHKWLEIRDASAAGVPECENDDLTRSHVVVDVVSDP